MAECQIGTYRRSREAWVRAHGPIPRGLHVCHTCDVPECVTLDHLWLGTRAENMNDCVRKGRHPATKLTSEQIERIRSAPLSVSLSSLAREFGVTRQAVSLIFRGKRAETR